MWSWLVANFEAFASGVTVGGGVVFVVSRVYRWWKSESNRRILERYLKDEKRKAQGSSRFGRKSLLHIVRHMGLTEDEILRISSKSTKIARRTSKDGDGFADRLLFEYVGDQ